MKKEKSTLSILENIRRKIRRIEEDDKLETSDENQFEYFDAATKDNNKSSDATADVFFDSNVDNSVEPKKQASEKNQSSENLEVKELEESDTLAKAEDEELYKDDFLDSDNNYDDFLMDEDSKKEQTKTNEKVDQVVPIEESDQNLKVLTSEPIDEKLEKEQVEKGKNKDVVNNEQIINKLTLNQDQVVKNKNPDSKNKVDGSLNDLDLSDDESENEKFSKTDEVEDFLITEVEEEEKASLVKVEIKKDKKDFDLDDLSDINLDDEEFNQEEKPRLNNKSDQDKDSGLNLDDIDLEDYKESEKKKLEKKSSEIFEDPKAVSKPALNHQNNGLEDVLISELEGNSEYMTSNNNDGQDLETQASRELNLNIKKISSGIVSSDAANKTTESIKKLIQAIPKKQEIVLSNPPLAFKSGETIEDMVIQILTPRLEQWISENLSVIVEKIVSAEIKKLIPKDD